MCWMALIPVAVAMVGGMMGAQNAKQEGAFNSGMFKQNAALKDQAANDTIAAGDTSADWQRVRTGQALGTQRAVQAANGIDVNSGSAAQLQDDTAMIGELDALTIQNNAAREAYGYRIQAQQDRANAAQTVTNAGNKATGSILGGLGSAFGSFAGAGNGSGTDIRHGSGSAAADPGDRVARRCA